MGISVLPNRFQFNGVISTDLTVLQNLETMCRAAGSYFTYDSTRGQWAVIINQTSASSRSFDDSNIIGSISLSSTGLDELYNSVRVTFPHQDLNDVRDFVQYAIASNDRFPNEADNELLIEHDIFNDPVQANILAITELKQNRRDLAIQFTTNFNSIGVVPGDVIDITSSMYGFAQRKFRVISVTEADTDDGNIVLDISALDYDEDVYDFSDLFRFQRSDLNGITTPGDLNPPPLPELVRTQVDSRPRVVVTALVPGNTRVERMEFWYSSNNANFEKAGTVTPVGGSGAFAVGDTVTFEFVPPVSGDIHFRVRAGNDTTAGPFSATVSNTFVPVQVPNAIDESTGIRTAGAAVGLLSALPDLLGGLDIFTGGDVGSSFGAVQQRFTSNITITNAATLQKLAAMTSNRLANEVYNVTDSDDRNNSIAASFDFSDPFDLVEFTIQTPTLAMLYDVLHQDNVVRTEQIFAQPAFFITLLEGQDLLTAVTISTSTIDWTGNNQFLSIENPDVGRYWVMLQVIPTYDLNLYWQRQGAAPNEVYFYDFTGDGVTKISATGIRGGV